MTAAIDSPLEVNQRLSDTLGVELFIKRDDLLPFPFAGNKVRKLAAELDGHTVAGDLVVSTGAIDSNHCRTLAMLGAERGLHVHLVLHGEGAQQAPALVMLDQLGASYEVVPVAGISHAIAAAASRGGNRGLNVHVVAGGCHTPLGAQAYRDAAHRTLPEARPDYVFLASGTGATHGGIAAAVQLSALDTEVVGISVAREHERGVAAVAEAATWAGARAPHVSFLDDYVDGGYGRWGHTTREAVELGWRFGIPLDPTYTGKAFAGMLDHIEKGLVRPGSRVLFWHTGGLWNAVAAISRAAVKGGSV